MPKLSFSIIILTWNSQKVLTTCLDKLSKQSYKNFETIIVDNGSGDENLDYISKQYTTLNLRIKKLNTNTGFAVANNIGAQMAQGEWLVLLNADAFPEPEWLEHLVKATEKYPNACFSSRQVQAKAPDLLDGEGDVYHISGLAWRSGYGSQVYPTSETVRQIFSPCAAAALYPRQAFLDVGGFDEDYFSYHEDVDLGFRLRLQGIISYHVPNAVVHHVGSASTGKKSDFSVYYGHRNLVWTYIKNMPEPLFWLLLPLHLFTNIAFLFYFSFRGQGGAIWRSKVDALKGLPKMVEKRRNIQALRISSSREIIRAMERNPLSPLIAFLHRRD